MITGFERYNLPCPCGKSSDAYAIDFKGVGKCFSCNKNFPKEIDETMEPVYEYKPQRGLTEETCQKWGILTKTIDDVDVAIGYLFPNKAVKQRSLISENKKDRFVWIKNEEGKIGEGLYGQHLFPKGSKPTLIITEGFPDAASIDQVLKSMCATVSVDSSSSAYKQIRDSLDYVNSFKKVIIAFDDDEQGHKAASAILPLFQDLSKIYRMTFSGAKDANELLQDSPEKLVSAFSSAQKLKSTAFIHTFTEVAESLVDSEHEVLATYPHKELQTLLRGLIRGRVTVWKGLEGIGKTEVFRWIEHHILKENPELKVAVIHMEEDRGTTIKGLATYETGKPMYFEEDNIPQEEIIDAYKKAVGGNEDRFFIYKIRGGDDPDEILTSIRTLVATTGVDVVFLDNINKMVDSLEEADERQKLVYIASKLKDMALELGFALEMISHVNDDGKTLGSRYTAKVSDRIVSMTRQLVSTDPIEKNTIRFLVEKNRGGKGTGVSGSITFNEGSYKLETL